MEKKRKGLHWAIILLIAFASRFVLSVAYQAISSTITESRTLVNVAFFADCVMRLTSFILSARLGCERYNKSSAWRGYLLVWCVIIQSILNVGDLYNNLSSLHYSYLGLRESFMGNVTTTGVLCLLVTVIVRIVVYCTLYGKHSNEEDNAKV